MCVAAYHVHSHCSMQILNIGAVAYPLQELPNILIIHACLRLRYLKKTSSRISEQFQTLHYSSLRTLHSELIQVPTLQCVCATVNRKDRELAEFLVVVGKYAEHASESSSGYTHG